MASIMVAAPLAIPKRSVFLQNAHYFYAQTDGSYRWPNGSVGDLLKQAKTEIEALEAEVQRLRVQSDRGVQVTGSAVIESSHGPDDWDLNSASGNGPDDWTPK